MSTPIDRLRMYLSEDSSSDRFPADIVDLRLDDTHVMVGQWEDGYVLLWTDYVANDWCEFYSTLSTVLARLSLLMYSRETQWRAAFDLGAEAFPAAAEVWFREMAK